MSAPFSYLQHPLLSCLRLVPEIFTGIDKVMVYYYNSATERTECAFISVTDSCEEIHEADLSLIKPQVNQWRTNSKNAAWHSEDELGFEVKQEKTKQLKLSSEDDNKILKICIPNNNDKKSDLIFIYFSSLLNVLPMFGSKKRLETSDKSIIQHLTEKMLLAYLNNEYTNKVHFESMSQTARNIIREVDGIKKKLSNTKEKYGSSLLSLCDMYLKQAEQKNKIFTFEFEQDAINKIKNYNGRIEDLEKIVADAVSYYVDIFHNTTAQHIKISDFSLYFDKISEKRSIEHKETGFGEYDSETFVKEIHILNRYEEVVKRLVNDDKKVTITSVGAYCNPRVTGAAISDAVNKNIDNFNKLFEKYPKNWVYVKKYLKPVSNKIILTEIRQEEKLQSNE